MHRVLLYSGKVWQGESLANCLWTKLVVTIDNLLTDLFICQTFFHRKSKFTKVSLCQTFPLYGILTSYYSYIPSHGCTNDNDVDAALAWSFISNGMLTTSLSLLFNNDSKASVCSWFTRVNHCSFSTDTISHPSPHMAFYIYVWYTWYTYIFMCSY